MEQINETGINIIAEGTKIHGKMNFEKITRIHGVLQGDVFTTPGSRLILGETAVVEGNIFADVLIVDGFVKGDIQASSQVMISSTGRVMGSIQTPSLLVQVGAYFEGKCQMEEVRKEPEISVMR